MPEQVEHRHGCIDANLRRDTPRRFSLFHVLSPVQEMLWFFTRVDYDGRKKHLAIITLFPSSDNMVI